MRPIDSFRDVRASSVMSRSLLGRLSSPMGLAIIIPLFILLSGGVSVAVSQVLMRRSLNEQVEQTTAAYAHVIVQSIADLFGQAAPVMTGLRSLAMSMPADGKPVDGKTADSAKADRAEVARALLTLVNGRNGLSGVGWALQDGSYNGIRLGADGWILIHLESDPAGRMIREEYRLSAGGALGEAMVNGDKPFDPRIRPWYVQALKTDKPVWNDHLQVGASGTPTVTYSEPLRQEGRPFGVALVAFNLTTLSESLDPLSDDPLIDNVLLTPDRSILAMPHDWVLPTGNSRKPTVAAMNSSPDVAAFRQALPDLRQIDPRGVRVSFLSHKSEQLCLIMPCTVRGGLQLLLAQVISKDLLLGKTNKALSWSLFWALLAMAGGIAVAWWFATRLACMRHKLVQERQRADAAVAEVELLGSYRLICKLGEGGMGEVWLGEHAFLARRAAIKRIRPDAFRNFSADDRVRALARFNREARITAALRSRHTVELYDYGTAPDGSFFYVMELLDGIDLGSLITRFGPQPFGRVVKILIQACSSLAEAHDCGLVHRDIKPENLYLCRRAEEVDLIKVIDFGIVGAPMDSRTGELDQGAILGTPATMSPEQVRGEVLDCRSDIYSLGCVAYSLLTGRDVFGCLQMPDLKRALLEWLPESPSHHRHHLPRDLELIVLACLAKDRNERPQNAKELAAMLSVVFVEEWTDDEAHAWWYENLPPFDRGILAAAELVPERQVSIALEKTTDAFVQERQLDTDTV